jgi:thiamine-monophosphate kinase
LGKHLQFTPRVKEGIWFSNQPETRAMMDITDGIAKDLLTMLEGVDLLSADLFLNTLPISEACHKYSQKTKKPAWEHALSDGEDYELLVLLKKGSDFNSFQKRWREAFNLSLSCIGIVSARGSGILWNSETNCKIEGLLGYEHIG